MSNRSYSSHWEVYFVLMVPGLEKTELAEYSKVILDVTIYLLDRCYCSRF